jgi:hypothetical protein
LVVETAVVDGAFVANPDPHFPVCSAERVPERLPDVTVNLLIVDVCAGVEVVAPAPPHPTKTFAAKLDAVATVLTTTLPPPPAP